MGSTGLAVPHVVAIGASAGGIKALSSLLARLPHDLAAPILIVQHLAPDFKSRLPDVLRFRSGYEVRTAQEGDQIQSSRAYVAPPDQHLTVDDTGRIRLRQTHRVHYVRPSVDTLFMSLAGVYKDKVIAVVLTGSGTDGAEGAQIVREQGGQVLVQSEASCEYSSMPASVVRRGGADAVLGLDELADRIVDLTMMHA